MRDWNAIAERLLAARTVHYRAAAGDAYNTFTRIEHERVHITNHGPLYDDEERLEMADFTRRLAGGSWWAAVAVISEACRSI